MGVWFLMFGCDLLLPAVMLVAGKLFLKGVPKDVHWIIGYRTAMSMKNEDTWRFAHAVAGRFWWRWGWISLVIAVLPMLLVLGQPEEVVSGVGLVLMFVLMIEILAVIPHTEKALRSTFGQDGTSVADGQGCR